MNPQDNSNVAIMVAPNGARLTTSDHPAIPVSATQVVSTVCGCVERGAGAVHLHVRDEQQVHVLDAARYKQSIQALSKVLDTDFPIQITTEAVGRFSQAEQIQVVRDVKPEFVSVALSEVAGADDQLHEAEKFYFWTRREHVAVQHILYAPEDLERFLALKTKGVIPEEQWSMLFVLGRYTPGQQSEPSALDPFLSILNQHSVRKQAKWMICAFGSNETSCLTTAAAAGGHVRVGFENNRHNDDGRVAENNEERVQQVVESLATQNQFPCNTTATRQLLGEL